MEPWFDAAVAYALDVTRFQDGNGDGIGDFEGLIRRLDYVQSLGVNVLWLLPFYPSPRRDGGYDVIDYCDVDVRIGSLDLFDCVIDEARRRGIGVFVDLVLNHTSDQHPWFQSARADRASPYRDFYVWRDEPQNLGAKAIFPGHQDGVWKYEPATRQHYLHRFYEFEPDLNIANEAVRRQILDIVRFWARRGVAGFRIDAAPYIAEKAGWATGDGGHGFLRALREACASGPAAPVLMAETDVELDRYGELFADGGELQLLFNFYANNYLWLALATENAEALADAVRDMPKPAPGTHFVNWLRNHDELDLERLTESQRDATFATFATDPRARVYQRGIRRRPAPMLGGDPRRIAMAQSIAFALPGMPILRHGDEIGMGDDLARPERESVRAPMQWTDEPNAGFSSAPAEQLAAPVLEAGQFGYKTINVAAQEAEPGSLLNRIRALVRARRQARVMGGRSVEVLDAPRHVVAFRYCDGHDAVVTLANLAATACKVAVPNAPACDIASDTTYAPVQQDGIVELGPYGYRWLSGDSRP